MVFDEVNKLYKNKEKIVKFYKENQERFINNHKKTIAITSDTYDYDFFQNLINLKING
jgi:peptidoglycan/xylan/chitin deacetylase (PgdA/CDA1 family)